MAGRRWHPDWVSYSDPAFRPYVVALGQLTLAWNELHEMLSLLFCTIMGSGVVNQYLAIWHTLKVDRAQRDMLLAAAYNHTLSAYPPRMVEDIEWLCKRADALEDERNNAVHSPLLGVRHENKVLIRPRTGLGHVRAKRLANNKDLLALFRWCRDATMALALFANGIDFALSDLRRPWPDRPEWPARPGTSAKKPRPPVRKARRPRQRQSSQE